MVTTLNLMMPVARDWINPKVLNDVHRVIFPSLTFATEMTGRSLLKEA